MKNQWKGFKGIICLVFVLAILVSCSAPSGEPSPDQDTDTKEFKPAIHSVEITQMKFSPAELRVKKGDKVVFVNRDMVTHDVTEESNKVWSSSPLATDQTWTLVVTESVNYFCSIHPLMKGKIVVK